MDDKVLPHKVAVLINLDDRLPEEDKKIVKSVLKELIGKYESLGGVPIPICYSDEHGPCIYYPYRPYHHVESQEYIKEHACGKYSKYRKINGVDAEPIIEDIRRRELMFYDPHVHIFIVEPPAYDFLCHNMVLGAAFPIIPSSIFENYSKYEEGAIFRAPGVAVISVGSIKKHYGDDWPTGFYGAAAYYFGILFGLPSYENPHRKGAFYCSHEYCAMGGISNKKRLDNILNNPNLYCEHDLLRLSKNLYWLFGGWKKSKESIQDILDLL